MNNDSNLTFFFLCMCKVLAVWSHVASPCALCLERWLFLPFSLPFHMVCRGAGWDVQPEKLDFSHFHRKHLRGTPKHLPHIDREGYDLGSVYWLSYIVTPLTSSAFFFNWTFLWLQLIVSLYVWCFLSFRMNKSKFEEDDGIDMNDIERFLPHLRSVSPCCFLD